MNLIIRPAQKSDFDSVCPLFQQLWPTKELHPEALKEVFCRGVGSGYG